MAEILIHKKGRGEANNKQDWQPFDVITVQENGHVWGTNELKTGGSFLVIKIPSLKINEIQYLLESDERLEIILDQEIGITIARRKRRFNPVNFPQKIKDIIQINGVGQMLNDLAEITIPKRLEVVFMEAIEVKN